MSSAPLRLAVIGAGVMGRCHIERIRESGACALAAVCDPDLPRARRAAGGECPVHAELPELLRRERIDGAIVATPTARHHACGALCAESGVPVLVEKPIAATTAMAISARRSIERMAGRGGAKRSEASRRPRRR